MAKSAPIVILLAIMAVTAGAAVPPPSPSPRTTPKALTPEEKRRNARQERYDRLDKLTDRAWELRPQRRDFPMRYLNISDEEVREIQVVAREFVPRSIVNIGTVVKGCPCEDGARCTDQVWIVASNPEKSTGLQLSRIDRQWTVGLVQRWWRRFDEIRSNRERFHSLDEYFKAEERLFLEFPSCVEAHPLAAEAATSQP